MLEDNIEENGGVRALWWEVNKKEKGQLIKRGFLVEAPHPKWGQIVWTCVDGDIIQENQDNKIIGLYGFDYTLFEEKEDGGVQQCINGYPYLKHQIQLCPRYQEEHLGIINEEV